MKKDLNIYIKTQKKYGEIVLFQFMQSYLSNKYNCCLINQTHKRLVNFQSPTTGCTKARELSDLWIITYSPKLKKARMTFLQAKFEKKIKSSNKPFNFQGDYFQYDLLSKRPQIINSNKFNFPNNILSSAISDSVGSFGVFYFNQNKILDFAFAVASDITIHTKPAVSCRTKQRQLYFQRNCNLRNVKKSGLELRSTLSADCFECALLDLLIGTPIEQDQNLIYYLKNYFKTIVANNIDDFKSFLQLISDSTSEEFYDSKSHETPNILLLNIDNRE